MSCDPCESPVVENIPGPQGEAGDDGADGTNGINAFTITTADFIQPAVNANVTVDVATSEWMVVNQDLFVEIGGYYQVIAKPTITSATIKNLGYDANIIAGQTIPEGAQVSPAGQKGQDGANGAPAAIPLTTKGDILGYDTAAARVGVGTDGKVLAADSAQGLGVNYVTVQPNTVALDNAIPRYNGTAGLPVPLQDSKVVITDDGSLQATGSGGNARGTRAVDLQVVRNADAQVASGQESVVGGGKGNTASALNATIAGGLVNEASATYATVGGGDGNVASGSSAAVLGGHSNVATAATAAIGGGKNNQATAVNSSIPGGFAGLANLFGQLSHANGLFEQIGDAQTSELIWFGATTDATPTELFLDNATLRAVIDNQTSWAFRLTMIAREDATGNTAGWEASGVLKNFGGVPALAAVATIGLIAADAGSISDGWGVVGALAVTADISNDSLKIEVTGAAAKNIRWVAHARLVVVNFIP